MHLVKDFLQDIAIALKLPVCILSDFTIKSIRSDVCVILLDQCLVGVVKVKKPNGKNILLEPTILGELLDQMLFMEGFYGMGAMIGILATGEEWLVSWFPADSTTLKTYAGDFNHPDDSCSTSPNSSTDSESDDESRFSPQGSGMPSQKNYKVHSIDIVEDVGEINTETSQQMERTLCTTEVMNIHKEPMGVLEVLCNAFRLMTMLRKHYHSNLSRCIMKFHKKSPSITFHPACCDKMHGTVNFNKYPGDDVKTLVALEDFGRGSTGKGWLCVTDVKLNPAVCVLKFDNWQPESDRLLFEEKMWKLLYPEFSSMIKMEHWSGADALVMPHFSKVLEAEREQYKEELTTVLTTKFSRNGKVHGDVRWSNIGKYLTKEGFVALVVFDLYDVIDYCETSHSGWIENALCSLYRNT